MNKAKRTLRAKSVIVIFLDYTDLPRAWGIAPDERRATEVAEAQLKAYCLKQIEYGELDLAEPSRYTKRVEILR